MTSSCHEAAKMWGTSLLNLSRHHPAWWSLSTEVTVAPGSKDSHHAVLGAKHSATAGSGSSISGKKQLL